MCDYQIIKPDNMRYFDYRDINVIDISKKHKPLFHIIHFQTTIIFISFFSIPISCFYQIQNKDENIHKQQSLFCSITDRQTDKIFTEQMLIYEGNLHQKHWSDISIGARKSRFPLNVVDIRTDGHLLLQSSFATKK